MKHTLILTKLNIPPPRPNLILRERLTERLNAGIQGKLTLVTAMAGSGKTTLVSEWVHANQLPAAWVNLEQEDNDPTRFFLYAIAAIQRIDGKLGTSSLICLQSPQALPPETLLTDLINDISSQAKQIILVLDDYHVIDNQVLHKALTFLLDHLPTQLHLVIITRSEPSLPLARLRAKGELNELHAVDLRFNLEETSNFLESMGLQFSSDQVSTLEVHTEGWAAGLQLAALSMRGQRDAERFTHTFTGRDRYVLNYLAEEVVNQLPEDTKDFLYRTSILGRLSGPLCDAVTGGINSQQILKGLEADNLFVIPLDNEQVWYRYHPLFADFLKNVLAQTDPDLFYALHRKASIWYQDRDLKTEAVNHGLEARDYDRTSQLIAQYAMDMVSSGEIRTLSSWLERLPGEVVENDARLSLALALTAFLRGDRLSLKESLDNTRKAISHLEESAPDKELLLAEVDALGTIAAIEIGEAFDLKAAQQTLGKLPSESGLLRASLAYTLGVAHRSLGDINAAGEAFSQALEISQESSNLLTALVAGYDLGALRADQGFLHEADKIHRQSFEFIKERIGEASERFPPAGAALIGLGRLLYEWGEFAEAQKSTREGIQLIEKVGGLGISKDGYLTLALIENTSGNTARAIELVEKAEKIARGVKRPEVLARLTPHKVKFWIRGGNLRGAANWLAMQDLDPENPPGYPFDLAYLTMVQVYIAQAEQQGEAGKLEDARRMLVRIQDSAETTQLPRQLIESQVISALALQASGKTDKAITTLSQALTKAEPEGHAALFVSEGDPIKRLLLRIPKKDVNPSYKARLLAGFDLSPLKTAPPLLTEAGTLPPIQAFPLVEPLSEREIEVLALVAGGLSNREIADQLYITIGTVKRHLTNIYQKLGVNNRTGAVTLGRQYNLIP